MKFEKIYTEFLKHFICFSVLIGLTWFISGCVSQQDYSAQNPENAEHEISIRDEEVEQSEIINEFSDEEGSKYGRRYSQFKNYKIDRSYMNAVDYPMDIEAYYASRFTNKKNDIKKQPFLATPVGFKISDSDLERFVNRVNDAGDNINSIEEELAIIRSQYAEILSLSKICCSYGFASKFEHIGIEDDYIFKFMIDDKRMYELQSICMVINDEDIAHLLGSVELAVITRDVRNSCVCKNQEKISKRLELFKSLLEETQLFQQNNIIFKYKNELGDVVKNNIGRDIVNLMDTLEKCP